VFATRQPLIALAAAAIGAVFLAGVATAKITPAWSYLSKPLRTELAAKSGGVVYLPARTPLFYRYRGGAKVTDGVLTVTFTNRVRIRQGLWRWTKQSFLWQVRPIARSRDCTTWAPVAQTFQMSGNKVYGSDANGGEAWRCVVDRHGTAHVLVASHAGARFPLAGYGFVVASGLDVSGRS